VDLYEHQGKELLRAYGIPVPEGILAGSAEEAAAAAAAIGGRVVIKAQVLSGGRGKAGGVRIALDADSARREAADVLGLVIGGEQVSRVWVEPACEIVREYYLSTSIDRGAGRALLMFTTAGGVEIEEVAAARPEALARVHVDPLEGLEAHHLVELLAQLDDPAEQSAVAAIVERLYRCFVESDASLCEVNPLVIDGTGAVVALDAKVTLDDSALYRHPDLAALAPPPSPDTLEGFAAAQGVTYVKLDGTVGIFGNGAGLTMSTVDVVAVAGGSPASFCDLGGGGSASGVVAALEVVARDPQVRSVLFNIFGGITRCDEVARGILAALDQLTLELPFVVRLEGTNADEGRRILAAARRPNLEVEATMMAAAERAVELAT
jgi:succinyl-CoA synthetase beta subunit